MAKSQMTIYQSTFRNCVAQAYHYPIFRASGCRVCTWECTSVWVCGNDLVVLRTLAQNRKWQYIEQTGRDQAWSFSICKLPLH